VRLVIVVAAVMLLSIPAQAQDEVKERHKKYLDRAEVHHLGDSATITANSPRPLADTLMAVSQEYGWLIDFEDPPYYSAYDLVDDTDSAYRAAHPDEKGVTAVGGAAFQPRFPEILDRAASIPEQERILDKIISDYNESSNPGQFSLRKEGGGRFSVIGSYIKNESGQDEAVNPVLDTPITIKTETRNAYETIELIVNTLTNTSKSKIMVGRVPTNLLYQTQVTVGGENIPARALISQVLSALRIKLYWHLYHDADVKKYALNLLPLVKVSYDASGRRTAELVQ